MSEVFQLFNFLNDFREYCGVTGIKPLSNADFGKVMKQVFSHVRPRRLGTRGNSRYCYSGMCKKRTLSVPTLPEILPDEVIACDYYLLSILYV